MYCVPIDGTFRIEKPNLQQAAAVSLTYGRNIFDLDLEMDARWQYQKVTALAWNQANQEVISADLDDIAAPAQGNLAGSDLSEVGQVENFELRHSGSLQQQEIEGWAEAEMIKSRFSKIRGTIRFQGNEAVTPGSLIELKGLGDRFNGLAFISGVRHGLGQGDWETTAQVGLRPEWHHELFQVSAPPAAGFHPAINGLHTGIVTQLQDDPAGEERIRVRVPLINAADDGIWSRVATLDAGANRGSFFLPEINDEVIVGFINDDPHEPVILGMLHSSNKPAPLPASDDNHEKGLVTRSGMKVIFNDDKSSLTIETPAGKQVVIDDDSGKIVLTDETGNTVTMNSDGIVLESPGKISLKATGDVSIEGLNVNLKANAAAKVEGSTGAALKSGGNTEVKGSLVQIN
jgi:Rhs element Vgr protein